MAFIVLFVLFLRQEKDTKLERIKEPSPDLKAAPTKEPVA